MTYLEIQEKIQNQALDNLKQIQAAQIATLQTAREVVVALPSLMSLPNAAKMEGVPTLAQLTELGTSFVTQLLEQGKAFTSTFAEAVSPAVKPSSN